MYNDPKEIIFILNILNINDNRSKIGTKEIFDTDNNFLIKNGKEIGKELFITKANGYISYVRGENPYSFPYLITPKMYNHKSSLKVIGKYPKRQFNNNKQEKLSIIEEKKTEKKLIEIDRGVKQQTFNKFKQEEKNLFTQLEVAERKKQNLKQEIAKAIKLEILVEQKKQEEIAKKERAKKEKAEKEKTEKLANEEKKIVNAETKKENLESKSIENT
jgi:hypothetical protein